MRGGHARILCRVGSVMFEAECGKIQVGDEFLTKFCSILHFSPSKWISKHLK